jgi:hypothetical protein
VHQATSKQQTQKLRAMEMVQMFVGAPKMERRTFEPRTSRHEIFRSRLAGATKGKRKRRCFTCVKNAAKRINATATIPSKNEISTCGRFRTDQKNQSTCTSRNYWQPTLVDVRLPHRSSPELGTLIPVDDNVTGSFVSLLCPMRTDSLIRVSDALSNAIFKQWSHLRIWSNRRSL